MNLSKFIKKLGIDDITIIHIAKFYDKTGHLRLEITTNYGTFNIYFTDTVKKLLSYFLNDIVKMNVTAEELNVLYRTMR